MVLATESVNGCAVYNVVDDQPVRYRELYGYLAAQMGADPPGTGGPATRSLGCGNARLKAALGWEPAYPTYLSGLA